MFLSLHNLVEIIAGEIVAHSQEEVLDVEWLVRRMA